MVATLFGRSRVFAYLSYPLLAPLPTLASSRFKQHLETSGNHVSTITRSQALKGCTCDAFRKQMLVRIGELNPCVGQDPAKIFKVLDKIYESTVPCVVLEA